jgi:ABC-type lipoprotein release transport system permease subunit
MPPQDAPPNPLIQLLMASPWMGIPNLILIGLVGMFLLILGLMVFGKVPLSYNLRNLRVRWVTTLLVVVAFTFVLGLLTVMLAFVNGMKALTENSGQPGNVMVLSQGSTDEGFSNLVVADTSDIENQPTVLKNADGQPLVSRETYLVVNQPLPDPPPGKPKRRFLQLRGIDDPVIAGEVHGLALKPGGNWFTSAGVRELEGQEGLNAVECVIGEGISRELGRDRGPEAPPLQVGDTFQLNERPWLVVGVMDSGGSTFDSEVWAKRSLVGPMFGKDTYTTLVCRTSDSDKAVTLAKFFNEEYTKASLNAQAEKDYYAGLNATNRQFLFAIIFVTIIIALGGVFGVMNTMFAAISQRIKDIGVLRLMGFGRRHILASFLLESLVIALIGGGLGLLLGSLVDGLTATSVVGSGGGGGGKFVVLKLTVDAAVIASGLLLTLLMGLFGGLIPALNAMRLTALDALR